MAHHSVSSMAKVGERENFILKHGVDVFLTLQTCFRSAPLNQRPEYWEDMSKALYEIYGNDTLKSDAEFDSLLQECRSFKGFEFDKDDAVVILPPKNATCPKQCPASSGRQLTEVTHQPNQAMLYGITGKPRMVYVLRKRCRACLLTLEYDMFHFDGKYHFYRREQEHVRITPNCYFSRDLCRHIVRSMVRGRSTFESFAELWSSAHGLSGLDRKWVSTAFYRHEVEAVMREHKEQLIETAFSSYNSLDDVLPFMESLYSGAGFPHAECKTARAESPSQVFLTLISSLYRHVTANNIPANEWKKLFVVYDNVCNLDRIKAAKAPLPLATPYDQLWISVSKVIDVFHLSNHKRPECKTEYHPDNIKKIHPDLKKRNTEVAEQTFSWLKRFKPALNAIPRDRQLFYLYRLIKHRNVYLACIHAEDMDVDATVEE